MVARAIVTGKVANCRTVIQRALRDHAERIDVDAMSLVSQKLVNSIRNLIDRASEPASGSVNAQQPIFSTFIIGEDIFASVHHCRV
jgi:CRISPR/Cas system-associated endonuclease Cas1